MEEQIPKRGKGKDNYDKIKVDTHPLVKKPYGPLTHKKDDYGGNSCQNNSCYYNRHERTGSLIGFFTGQKLDHCQIKAQPYEYCETMHEHKDEGVEAEFIPWKSTRHYHNAQEVEKDTGDGPRRG